MYFYINLPNTTRLWQVCKYDATEVERQIEGELFDKWEESCQVTKAKKIPISKLEGYLDHLRKAYDGNYDFNKC